jgi:hypothetical protein
VSAHEPHKTRWSAIRATDGAPGDNTQLKVFRATTEIAILLAAMAYLGLIPSRPSAIGALDPGAASQCVYFGRAGAACDAQRAQAQWPQEDEAHCVSLGRAGHVCRQTPR